MDLKDNKGNRDHKVNKAFQAKLDLRVIKGTKELRAHQEIMAHRAALE